MTSAKDWRVELAAGLEARRAALEVLGSVLEDAERAEARALLRDLERATERARSAGVVALVGPTGAGKSSLFNALVGERASEVSEVRPTTQGLIAAEAAPGLARELLGPELCSGAEVRHVHALEAFDAPVVLVDGPDHNSHAHEHREVSCQLVERADLLLVVTHPQGIVELAGLSFLARFLGRRRVVGILGHVESHAPPDREALLRQLDEVLTEALGRAPAAVLPVDGRRSPGQVAPAVSAEAADPAGEQWDQLQRVLQRELRSGALGRLLQANAEGAEERLSRLAASAGARLEAREREEVEALAGALERWREGLSARVQAWVEASAGGWRTLSRQALAAAMGGLAGFVLHRSWAQLGGLVTGGLLVRRSPLVGAGMLAAGTLASKRSPDDPAAEGLLPETELEEVARLGAAVQGELELDGWMSRSRRVVDALRATWGSSLRSGGRSVPLAARALLELPLALLLLRGVALASLGLFGGPGFGVDGFLDTLLLGGAWAVVWRASMGAWADRGARGAQARLMAQVARACGDEAQRVQEERSALGEELRTGLEILSGAPGRASH